MKELLNIAIFGGSFNPPTIQHMKIGYEVLSKHICDKLIYVPCGSRDDKILEANNEQRLKMITLSVKSYFNNDKRVEIDDVEIKHGKLIPTYYLLNMYKEKYPNSKIYFIMGSDLPHYYSFFDEIDKLKKEFDFLIFRRPGYVEKTEEMPERYTYVKDYQESEISSTMVRNFLKNNKEADLSNYIVKDVIEYIKQEDIYK